MPKVLISLAASIFGDEASRNNYVTLTSGARGSVGLFSNPPKSLLAIPQGAIWNWGNDYEIAPDDFLPRALALSVAAHANAKAMLDPYDDGTPAEWTLVFRLGCWKGAHLHLNDDDASIHIDTGLTLARPTAEEVKQFGGMEAGKAVNHA